MSAGAPGEIPRVIFPLDIGRPYRYKFDGHCGQGTPSRAAKCAAGDLAGQWLSCNLREHPGIARAFQMQICARRYAFSAYARAQPIPTTRLEPTFNEILHKINLHN